MINETTLFVIIVVEKSIMISNSDDFKRLKISVFSSMAKRESTGGKEVGRWERKKMKGDVFRREGDKKEREGEYEPKRGKETKREREQEKRTRKRAREVT